MRPPSQGAQLPLVQVLAYVRHLASALQYAHGLRLIHCDVKPESILVGAHEELLLSYFGSALFVPLDRLASVKGMVGPPCIWLPSNCRAVRLRPVTRMRCDRSKNQPKWRWQSLGNLSTRSKIYANLAIRHSRINPGCPLETA